MMPLQEQREVVRRMVRPASSRTGYAAGCPRFDSLAVLGVLSKFESPQDRVTVSTWKLKKKKGE
jgi:hypothetical protein